MAINGGLKKSEGGREIKEVTADLKGGMKGGGVIALD
jgi:hypothetical protein